MHCTALQSMVWYCSNSDCCRVLLYNTAQCLILICLEKLSSSIDFWTKWPTDRLTQICSDWKTYLLYLPIRLEVSGVRGVCTVMKSLLAHTSSKSARSIPICLMRRSIIRMLYICLNGIILIHLSIYLSFCQRESEWESEWVSESVSLSVCLSTDPITGESFSISIPLSLNLSIYLLSSIYQLGNQVRTLFRCWILWQ